MTGEESFAIEEFLLETYRIGQVRSVVPIPQGLENLNFRVQAETADYVLRIYSQNHSTAGLRRRSDIAFELDLMAQARRHGVPAPEWVRTRTGSDMAEITLDGVRRYAVLFSYVQGEQVSAYNQENARAVVETLLRLRHASRRYRSVAVRAWPGDMAGLSLAYYRQNRHQNDHYRVEVDALYSEAAQGYQQLPTTIPLGVIHGDNKLENLLFVGNSVKAVLDFDDYRRSYLIEEIARTVMHDLDSVDRNVLRSGQFAVFQAAVDRDGGVSAAERSALITFLKARFLYDISVYQQNGLTRLVEELFSDRQIAAVILS